MFLDQIRFKQQAYILGDMDGIPIREYVMQLVLPSIQVKLTNFYQRQPNYEKKNLHILRLNIRVKNLVDKKISLNIKNNILIKAFTKIYKKIFFNG